MAKVLCTFSGKLGDVLWSLPTVKEIAHRVGEPVDMLTMFECKSLLPLLEAQPYIRKAWASEEWQGSCTGSPHGNQPWQAPVPEGMYDRVDHLTYRYHPVLPLMVHTARVTAGIELPPNPLPFLEVDTPECLSHYAAYAFNPSFGEQKEQFTVRLRQHLPDIAFVDVGAYPWLVTAAMIKNAAMFIGCRSANYVIAHGLAKKVLVYEPNIGRWPETFGCPYGTEVMPNVNDFDAFVRTVYGWMTTTVEAA